MPKKNKTLCVDDLRHVEYYGMQPVFDELYHRSLEGENFTDLMDLILSRDNILLAYRNIKANGGSYTAGTDNKNISDIGCLPPETVAEKVRFIVTGSQHGYRPKPVRRKDIPKPNGKTRPLGIPCIWDRLVQQCIKQVIEPICEAKFSDNSYGFRPNRSVEHAVQKTYTMLQRMNLLLFIMVSAGLSSCGSMFSGLMNGILGTSYTSEDSDLVATENNYAAKENELQQQIDNIESTHPGYDEYRYDLDSIGHNPHELASYLTALLQTYTPQSAQAELNRVFAMQYTLTLTEETEIRYRTETSTDPETGETTTEEVPYEYHILNVKLTNKPISEIAEELLTPQQLEMYRVYLETSGNKPLIFGGGSPDMGASEDLSGVQLVNGTRPGNTAVVDLAKRQVGNVGGRPFWSWYGFNSRVEWCACFVSWCYNQAGKSEPRFAGCQSQGVPWFQSRGQWGARGYENIAPGDAIFFDWDGDGSADHVGLVIGTDGERVYTVEGNSGDACKIKSYPVNYSCIKGYGLMNWN